MSDYFDDGMSVVNPYAVGAANPMQMDTNRHDSGNAVAANMEARAISEVKAQVFMARQYPRDPLYSMDQILNECKRPTLADAAVYTFPRGKETVSGPSIRLAEVLARNWGNVNFGQEVLERGVDKRGVGFSLVRAFAWDLQTNLYVSRQFEVKHFRSTRTGGYKLTDDRDIYELEANMGARRLRACILQVIPGDVTSAAVNACRQTASSGLNEMMKDEKQRAALVAKMLRIYEKLGVAQVDLETYLNTRMEDWSADEMLKLKELKNGLDDGAISLGDIFPHLAGNDKNQLISKEQVTQLMEAAAKTGRQGEISDALKRMKIAKFADVPAARFDEVVKMIASFMPEKPAQIAEGKTEQKGEKQK